MEAKDNTPACRSELQCVAEEVGDDLSELGRIGHEKARQARSELNGKRDSLLLCPESENGLEIVKHSVQVEGLWIESALARFDTSHLQDLVHDGQQILPTAQDAGQTLALLGTGGYIA